MAKLGHHAYSQRVEGLTGLQDWMKYGGGIDDLLSKVVVKSLSLIADADSAVRDSIQLNFNRMFNRVFNRVFSLTECPVLC